MYFYKYLIIPETHICRVYSVYPSFLLLHLSASSWSVVKVSQEHNSRFNCLRRSSFYCDRWAVCEGGLLLQHCGFKGKKKRRRRSRFIYEPFKTPASTADTAVLNWRSCTATFEWSYFKEQCSCQQCLGSSPVPSVWTHKSEAPAKYVPFGGTLKVFYTA